MIRFQNVDNEKRVLSIDKKDQDELNENVMTVFEVASTLATGKEQFDQLYAMLDTVPDFSVVIPRDRFEKLNVGYGLFEKGTADSPHGTIVPIVIYRTSSGALSFIMYMYGRISKIYPEADDIFTTSFQEAVEEQDELTRRNLAKLQENLEKSEQEQDDQQNDDECPTSCSYRCRCMDCGADCSAATQQNHEKLLESLKAAEYPTWMDFSDKAVFDALKETLLNFFGDSLYSDDDESEESEPAEEEIPNLDKFVETFGTLIDNAKATEETVNELTKYYEQIHKLEQRLAALLANKVKLQCMADENFKNLCK